MALKICYKIIKKIIFQMLPKVRLCSSAIALLEAQLSGLVPAWSAMGLAGEVSWL